MKHCHELSTIKDFYKTAKQIFNAYFRKNNFSIIENIINQNNGLSYGYSLPKDKNVEYVEITIPRIRVQINPNKTTLITYTHTIQYHYKSSTLSFIVPKGIPATNSKHYELNIDNCTRQDFFNMIMDETLMNVIYLLAKDK